MTNTSIILKEFKQCLKTNRLRSGYNYKELAKLSGISDQTLRKYENDPNTDLPLSKLFILLQILHAPTANVVQIIQLFY